MFRCENCGRQTQAGERANKHFEYREKEYTNVRYVFDEKTRKKKKEYYTTNGQEIVKEYKICNHCVKEE